MSNGSASKQDLVRTNMLSDERWARHKIADEPIEPTDTHSQPAEIVISVYQSESDDGCPVVHYRLRVDKEFHKYYCTFIGDGISVETTPILSASDLCYYEDPHPTGDSDLSTSKIPLRVLYAMSELDDTVGVGCGIELVEDYFPCEVSHPDWGDQLYLIKTDDDYLYQRGPHLNVRMWPGTCIIKRPPSLRPAKTATVE